MKNKEHNSQKSKASTDNNNLPDKQNDDERRKLPDELAEALEEVPAEQRKTISMAIMRSTMRTGMVGHPLFEKFTPDHIDKFLDYSQKDDENEYKYKSSNRLFYLAYSILGIGVFVFLVLFLLPSNKELMIDIFKMLIAFAGGLGSGYGLKASKK